MVGDNNHLSSHKFRYEENGQHTWTSFAVLHDTLKPAPSKVRQGDLRWAKSQSVSLSPCLILAVLGAFNSF